MLNQKQQYVHDLAVDFYYSDSQIFEYSGGPGRGKSYVLNEILKTIGLGLDQIAPMTFTGTAAINMRRKGMATAKTAHSWLYEVYETPLTDKQGNIILDYKLNRPLMVKKFRPKALPDSIKLVAVDEGGSVPLSVANEIIKQGKKIIVTGDIDQLPPVGEPRGFFKNPDTVVRLDMNMRQGQGNFNGIEFLSQRALAGLPLHCGIYGNNAMVIPRSKLTKELLLWTDVLICNKNATRDQFTNIYRNIFGYGQYKLPRNNEPILCKENIWDLEVDGINLVNGLRGRVINFPDASGIDFQNKSFKVDFLPDNMISSFSNIDIDLAYFNADYHARKEMKDHSVRYSSGLYFEYGYAITSYASQGSEYDKVIYIQEPMNRNISNKMDYVGITRASKYLIVVLNNG